MVTLMKVTSLGVVEKFRMDVPDVFVNVMVIGDGRIDKILRKKLVEMCLTWIVARRPNNSLLWIGMDDMRLAWHFLNNHFN